MQIERIKREVIKMAQQKELKVNFVYDEERVITTNKILKKFDWIMILV